MESNKGGKPDKEGKYVGMSKEAMERVQFALSLYQLVDPVRLGHKTINPYYLN